MNRTQNRIVWIDYAKCIGIFLVVLGHLSIPEWLKNMIYAFHMPLFFFISGYLFQENKFNSLRVFFVRRAKQLLVPYLFFNIIAYFFWVFVGRKFGNDSTVDINPFTPLIGMLYGVNTGYFLIHCGSLWFLPCLFIVEILYYIAIKSVSSKAIIFILFTGLGYANLLLKHVMLPWNIDIALVAILFYIIGSAFKERKFLESINTQTILIVIFFCSLLLTAVIVLINGRVDMSSNTYGNFIFFILAALSGICFVFSVSKLFSMFFHSIPTVETISSNTLIIIGLHELVISIIKGGLYFIFKIPINVFKDTVMVNVIMAIVTILLLIPIFYIIEKYFPFIVGKSDMKI